MVDSPAENLYYNVESKTNPVKLNTDSYILYGMFA